MNFARLLVKDEIKKGSFSLSLRTGSVPTDESSNAMNLIKDGALNGDTLVLSDHGGSTSYYVNSPAGEYGLLYSASGDNGTVNKALGLLYYQAGIAFITSSIFRDPTEYDTLLLTSDMEGGAFSGSGQINAMVANNTLDERTGSVEAMFVSGAISASCGGLRNSIRDISFNNTTELNSTIYFCRASHNEFNYSSNPTFIDTTSKIRVKETSFDQPSTYITAIGLYSADNELLAVAKLSEPIKKTPENELTFRVRLDY